jgi:hypothetical protein
MYGAHEPGLGVYVGRVHNSKVLCGRLNSRGPAVKTSLLYLFLKGNRYAKIASTAKSIVHRCESTAFAREADRRKGSPFLREGA